MEPVNLATDEMPTIKTLDETEPTSQPGTPPVPPKWNDGSPQGFSHRFSRTRKVTARRNVTSSPTAPSYILDMMRTDPSVEFNTIDLTCDDDTSRKLQAGLTNNYPTLPTNGETYPNFHSDAVRKRPSTPGFDSFEGLGITIDKSEYVPRHFPPPGMHHPVHFMRPGGLKTPTSWMNTPLDPTSLSQNQMLAMMLQTSQPIPRPWGRESNLYPTKSFGYPGVDLSKYGPLPQLQPIPPTFADKIYQESKTPPAYPYIVPPSDLMPVKDIKRERVVKSPIGLSDIASLESMQMRWTEPMSSSASSECSISTGSRHEDTPNKSTSQNEQPNKRRRITLQVPATEPHLWTRKGLRPCAARLARSAEETMQLNSPVGDKSDTWTSQEPPSPQYSDISDAPSTAVSIQNSRHSRSSSISPHGSSVMLSGGTVESPKKSPSKTSPISNSGGVNIKPCAVRVPRCSSKLSVSLASSAGSSVSETLNQQDNDLSNTQSSTPNANNVEGVDGDAPFQCPLCKLRFWKEDLFRDHACLGRPWHQCPHCLSRFLSVANLQRHMANKHSGKSSKMNKMLPVDDMLSSQTSNKSSGVSEKMPSNDLLTKAPEGMSENDIHEWLFSVWDYTKDKPVPSDGIKCLFCEKVSFQVLSIKAHLLGVHKINLFSKQYQTAQNFDFLQADKSEEVDGTRLDTVELNKAVYKGAKKSSSSSESKILSPLDASSHAFVGKAKSGSELKLRIASLLKREIEKSKEKLLKPKVEASEKPVRTGELKLKLKISKEHIVQEPLLPNKVVKHVPNGVVQEKVGIVVKGGKPKLRTHYVQSLCETMLQKNVSVVQLRNWLQEINTNESEHYECILCKKVFTTLKSMQCHCLSVHRIPPGLKNFKPIWKGLKALRANLQSEPGNSENVGEHGNLDERFSGTVDLKHDITNCLTKNLRNLLVKSHLVGNDDCTYSVKSDVKDFVQYAVHSVSEEAMVASMKQFHPPVIMGVIKPPEENAVLEKLDKEPPSDEAIDKWLDSLKAAVVGKEDNHKLECLMCSEMCEDVDCMATHVRLVHRLTGLPLPSLDLYPNKVINNGVDTQASETVDLSVTPSPLVMELNDLRMYTKVLLMRLYSDETLSAFGFPESSTDHLLMRILEHSGFSYCWFESETEELLHNALCRNLKTLMAVSLPPDVKAHVNLNTDPMPVVLKALIEYTDIVPTGVSDSVPTRVPDSLPTSVPDSLPTSVPDSIPTSVTDSIPTSFPDRVPTSVSDSAPAGVPDSIPTSAPDSAPISVPDSAPSSAPDSAPSSVPDSAPSSVPDSAPSSVPDSAPSSVCDSVPSSVPDSVPTSVPDSIPASVPDSVPTSISDSVLTSVPDSVPTSVLDSVRISVPDSVPTSVPDGVPTSVSDSVPDSVPDSIATSVPE